MQFISKCNVFHGWFLEGLPEVLNNLSYDFLNDQYGYFIRVNAIKLRKHLYFPLTSKINEDGVRISQLILVMNLCILIKVGLGYLVIFQKEKT